MGPASSGTGVGPVVISNTEYDLDAESPVPIEGLVETAEMFAFMELEAIGDSTASGPDAKDLNGDGDETDPVVVLRDRERVVIKHPSEGIVPNVDGSPLPLEWEGSLKCMPVMPLSLFSA